MIRNKKGVQLAISTLILMVLGILVLIGLITILIMGWGDFKTQIGVILGSDIAKSRKSCQIQCGLENNYDYCCEEKLVLDNEIITCQDELLKGDCVMECVGACGEFPLMPPLQ